MLIMIPLKNERYNYHNDYIKTNETKFFHTFCHTNFTMAFSLQQNTLQRP